MRLMIMEFVEFMDFVGRVLQVFLGVYAVIFVLICLVIGCLCVFFGFLFYKFYLEKNANFQYDLSQSEHPKLFKVSEFFGAVVVVFLLMVFVFSLFALIFLM